MKNSLKGDARREIHKGRDSSAQSDFKLCANSDYDSRGSADPRESLRKRRILKLALTAHKVLSAQALLPAAVL